MILIYNPSHDMVLASQQRASFTPPALIQQFESDLSLLPIWYAKDGDFVISNSEIDESLRRFMQLWHLDKQLSIVRIPLHKKLSQCEFAPWGINEAVCRRYLNCTNDVLKLAESVRLLSHRRISIAFLNCFVQNGLFSLQNIPEEFFSVETLFNGEKSDSVVKLPWSSSGRGVIFISRDTPLSDPRVKRIGKAISEQGSVIAEKKFNKVLDFAAEFELKKDGYVFAGYSVFSTSNGAYSGNLLASNEDLEKELLVYISKEKLDAVLDLTVQLLNTHIPLELNLRYVGVDMMVYESGGVYKLHPCIELNLRMTMGMVARRFFDKFLSPSSRGSMEVVHFKSEDEYKSSDAEFREKYPLKLENGKIESGYIRLTSGEVFAVRCIIEP